MLGAVICAVVGVPVFTWLLQEVLHWLLGARFIVHTTGAVLVTGSSTGIGHAIAVDLAKATKLTVFASVRKQEDFAKLTAYKLPNLIPVILDVTSTESIGKCYETIQAHLKSAGIPFVGLVNNAGLGHGMPAEFYPIRAARQVFDVNVFGVLETTQRFLPLLRESKGRIIIISSVAGTNSFPAGSVYCGSKFAVEAMADAMRRELFGRVAVSLMEPAFVHSELLHHTHELSHQVMLDGKVDLAAAAKVYPKFFNEKRQQRRRELEIKFADEPKVVSDAVLHAFTSIRPYTRYRLANLYGLPAWIAIWLLWLLPDSVADFLMKSI